MGIALSFCLFAISSFGEQACVIEVGNTIETHSKRTGPETCIDVCHSSCVIVFGGGLGEAEGGN